MKPEDLVERLQEALRLELTSVILFGSAAAGDHLEGRSDYNVLVIVKTLGLSQLNAVGRAVKGWLRAGNPAPLLFTREGFRQSADTFPIEILDIRQSRRVLYGEDVTALMEVSTENLRLEVEHELKGKLIQLRERYLSTAGDPKRVAALMTGSLSTFLVLCRAALRLYQAEVPLKKMEVLPLLSKYVFFDPAVFGIVHDLKAGKKKLKDVDPLRLFEDYLQAVERVVAAVDSYVRSFGQGRRA